MASTVHVGGRAFHSDFSAPPTDVILQSRDGLHFYFDLAALARFSSFFSDIAGIPTAPDDNVIPLPAATGAALALALGLVSNALDPERGLQHTWPCRETLISLMDVVDAYDLPIVATALIYETTPAAIWDSGTACFERLVVAVATRPPDLDLEDVARLTALHRLEAQDEWVKDLLGEHPDAMSKVALWRAAVESLVQGLLRGLRGPSFHPAPGVGYLERWLGPLFPESERGYWTRSEFERWLRDLELQLLERPWAYPLCPKSAGRTFRERFEIKLEAFHHAVRDSHLHSRPIAMTLVNGLLFHCDFSSPTTADIFQSEDGVHFFFSLPLLATLSSFFKDLADLPQPLGRDGSPTVIPLLSATEEALALALGLVREALNPRLSSAQELLPSYSRKTLEGLIDIVNAYDLPLVSEKFLERSAMAMMKQPTPLAIWGRVIVAAATGSPKLATVARATILAPLNMQDEWTRSTMRRYPSALPYVDEARLHLNSQIDDYLWFQRARPVHAPQCWRCFEGEEPVVRLGWTRVVRTRDRDRSKPHDVWTEADLEDLRIAILRTLEYPPEPTWRPGYCGPDQTWKLLEDCGGMWAAHFVSRTRLAALLGEEEVPASLHWPCNA
ncbi:hypothetical protein Q8F55_006654 [Vanrija albida]|uniref:BTB domain-containing protein n=1 Tax=Vanrija albida TaxID=181172 RepID=A0ABR3PY26_9TREE